MARKITRLYMLVKVDGAAVTVRQVSKRDDGSFGFGEAVELSAAQKAQLINVAESLRRKLEG